MKYLIENRKYLYNFLGLLALAGILFPLISIDINLFGNITIDLNILNLLQNIGDAGEQMMQNDIAQFLQGNQEFSQITRVIILPFGAYLLILVLIIITLVLCFIEKFKSVVNILLISAIALCIYIGFAITVLPLTLNDALIEMFENHIFASMINISNIISINLGKGYWLTTVAIVMLLVTKCVIEGYKKKYDIEKCCSNN